MVYSDEIEDKIDLISEKLEEQYPDMINVRWHAIKILENDEEIISRYPADLSEIIDRSYEQDIINQKYDFIEEVIAECLVNKEAKAEKTDRIDGLLTHKIWAIPSFASVSCCFASEICWIPASILASPSFACSRFLMPSRICLMPASISSFIARYSASFS